MPVKARVGAVYCSMFPSGSGLDAKTPSPCLSFLLQLKAVVGHQCDPREVQVMIEEETETSNWMFESRGNGEKGEIQEKQQDFRSRD